MPTHKKLPEARLCEEEHHRQLGEPGAFQDRLRQRDQRRFAKKPIRAVASFLDCFGPEGGQFCDIPPYVIEFLVDRFQSFMRGDHKSLDEAFGGRTARQRNSINQENVNNEVVFDFIGELEAARKMTPDERARSTPFEVAVARTAEKHNLSEDTVRDIYKKSK